jgi:anti-sigma regulatory factor (Ser/Thr protein kinase)
MRREHRLAVSPEAAAHARRALDGLATAMPAARLHDVRLLVSELVTNAVRHANLAAEDVILLVIDYADRRLRVEVEDPGSGFALSEPSPDPTRPSGWGLYLVAQLADRWGVDSDGRTLVWFELDRQWRPSSTSTTS